MGTSAAPPPAALGSPLTGPCVPEVLNFCCALFLLQFEGGDVFSGWRPYLQRGSREGGVALVARFASLECGTDRANVDVPAFAEGILAVGA